MSYILEALRKVERQRKVRTIPDLATVHGPSQARRLWMPVFFGALLVNAGFVALLLWYRPWASSEPLPPPLAQAPAADVAGTPPAVPEAPAPPPAVASAPALTPAPSPGAASPGSTTGVDSPAQQSSAATPDVPALSTPRVRINVPASPGEATAARDAAAPEPSGTPERPVAVPGSSSRPAPAPGELGPTPGATPQPARPTPSVAVKTAIPADLPAPFRAAVAQLRLEALVYADNPKDRKVFISGRRYVEGDKLDSGIVVERIVEEGAVLGYAGHRHVLRHFR